MMWSGGICCPVGSGVGYMQPILVYRWRYWTFSCHVLLLNRVVTKYLRMVFWNSRMRHLWDEGIDVFDNIYLFCLFDVLVIVRGISSIF